MHPPPTPLPAALDADLPASTTAGITAARGYAAASRAAATRRAYATDWTAFSAWCRDRGLEALPARPASVAVWLAEGATAGAAPSTIGRRLAAIGHVHRRAGHHPPQRGAGGPLITDVVAGIRRAHATPPRKKQAADADVLRDLLRAITGDGLKDARDRALLAIGFAGALRRAELAALRLEGFCQASRQAPHLAGRGTGGRLRDQRGRNRGWTVWPAAPPP